ncbi:hypothetical protein [Halobaculum sp. MBLA0143]|uniref:hypothetical protein n=1 Tax=Halobaculum sp. MBLA0143 TaxID=3079933 RepID=UPI003524D4BF
MQGRAQTRNGVSRRQTLAAVGGATVSGLAGVPATVVGDSGREKRITTLATGSKSQETVTVSKRWYRHKEQAIKVKEALKRQHLGEKGVHSVGIETDDRSVGGLRGKRVRVAATPEQAGALDAVPSSVEGIPVRAVEAERPQQTDCYTGSADDSDGNGKSEYIGGMTFEGLEDLGTSNPSTVQGGTLCCRVYKGGTKYMMTARHPISNGACENTDITDGSYGWGRSSNDGVDWLGGVAQAYQKFDAALLDLRFPNYDEFTYDITAESSGGIIGRVTGDGIDYLQSAAGATVRKRGRVTCETIGTIEEIRGDVSYCNGSVTEENQIVTSLDQKVGDSGGPVYRHLDDGSNPDDLYLLHIATRRTDTNGYAQGSSANAMNKQEGITFGGNPYDG